MNKMEIIIKIWLKFGYAVFWIGWLGSKTILNVSNLTGIGIGLMAVFVWFVILNIFSKINGEG